MLDYKPRPGSNQPPPPVWQDDPAYLRDVAALLPVLRELVDAKGATRVKSSAIRFAKHFDTFLEKFAGGFGTAMAWGTAGLLIGGAGALLTYAGVSQPIIKEIFLHWKGGH